VKKVEEATVNQTDVNVQKVIKKFTDYAQEIGFNSQRQQNDDTLAYKEIFRRSNEFVLKDKSLKNAA